MDLKRCKNGHFYDAEKYSNCPHCDGGYGMNPTITIPSDPGNDSVTIPGIEQEPTIPDIGATLGNNKGNVTISYYEDLGEEQPVVGWLVCIKGKNLGKDFRLTAERNNIGRDMDMDIVLDDNSVSREKHAIVSYDHVNNIFTALSGMSGSNYYLNGNPVYMPTPMSAYDILSVGKTDLLFIPFCSEKFTWDTLMEDKKDEK